MMGFVKYQKGKAAPHQHAFVNGCCACGESAPTPLPPAEAKPTGEKG